MSVCEDLLVPVYIFSFLISWTFHFPSAAQDSLVSVLNYLYFYFGPLPYQHYTLIRPCSPLLRLTNLFLARKCPVISLFENLVQYDHLYKYPQALPSLYLHLVNTNIREVRRNQFDNLHQFYLTESCYNNIIERPSHMCKIRHGRLIDWWNSTLPHIS